MGGLYAETKKNYEVEWYFPPPFFHILFWTLCICKNASETSNR